MIKIVALVARNPNLSLEEFRKYWEEVHAPLIRRKLPGLVKYTGGFVLPRGTDIAADHEMVDYDLVVELGFPDVATMERDFRSDAFQSLDRLESAAHFMDVSRERHFLVEEVDVT